MSDQFVKIYQKGFNFAIERYEKFLAICSDDAWKEKAGGWTLAQQYYHGLLATNMLLSSVSGEEVANPDPEAGLLEEKPDVVPDKSAAALFLANIKLGAADFFEKIDDATLLQKNEKISKKFGSEIVNAFVLELIPCHLLYHLGSCDAALRNRNLPGSW